MFQIIQPSFVAQTFMLFGAYIVVRECIIRYREHKRREFIKNNKIIVGVIEPQEVLEGLTSDWCDAKLRKSGLSDLPITKHNTMLEVRKARALYDRSIEQIELDEVNMLY